MRAFEEIPKLSSLSKDPTFSSARPFFKPMSNLQKLLKGSKISQLAEPNRREAANYFKLFPTHQVIQTTPNSLYRKDYGLKANLPSKVKSRFLELDEMDTMQRMTDFECLSGSYWKKVRFQEMNLPISFKKNALFEGFTEIKPKSENLTNLSVLLNFDYKNATDGELKILLGKLRELRKPFVEWLLKTKPSVLLQQSNDFSSEIRDFLAMCEKSPYHYKKLSQLGLKKDGSLKTAGTAGLSYALKGRLCNTPNGIQAKKIIPGRYVGDLNKNFAVGGFIARGADSASTSVAQMIKSVRDKHPRQLEIPVSLENAEFNPDNSLRINVTPMRGNNATAEIPQHPFKSARKRDHVEVDTLLKLLM